MFTDRQEQIIKTAIRLIANKGIQNLTTKNLAKDIGISEPALYRHFDNKLEILKGTIKYFKILTQPAFNKMDEADQSILQIENFFLCHLKIFNNNPDFAKVIFSEANFQNEEILLNLINTMMNKSQLRLKTIVVKGQNSKEVNTKINPLNITRIIIGSIRFLIVQWTMSGMIFNLETEGKQLWNDIKKMIVNTN